MTPGITIRAATVDDVATLSALAFRSKAHWGYSLEFMAACKAELTYSAEMISAPQYHFYVCEDGDDVVAFYALEVIASDQAELEALFVEPDRIGTGVGKLMMDHCKSVAVRLGVSTLTIQGDPNAEAFFIAAGANAAGYRESSSIAGRQLPVFRIEL